MFHSQVFLTKPNWIYYSDHYCCCEYYNIIITILYISVPNWKLNENICHCQVYAFCLVYMFPMCGTNVRFITFVYLLQILSFEWHSMITVENFKLIRSNNWPSGSIHSLHFQTVHPPVMRPPIRAIPSVTAREIAWNPPLDWGFHFPVSTSAKTLCNLCKMGYRGTYVSVLTKVGNQKLIPIPESET